ncbi:glycosyltransferase family 2 protein [Roseovarius sp. D22-M7]|uniref:glycosyltransferase family 2 protein n=1 Tax=Roseovarius sp. D22-M7 TaxID=3127116 RepID=UPI0030104F03
MSLERSNSKELTPATPARLAVVIPCYNAAPWLERTINSVLAQIRPDTSDVDILIILADDGSTDDSVAVASGFGERVQILTGPNRGACHARNAGLAAAEQEGIDYIVFLDADDYYEGDPLISARRLATERKADMILSNMHMEYKDGTRKKRYRYSGQVEPETFFDGWTRGDVVNPAGILWRTDFVRGIGAWDESLARAQDREISLRAMFSRPLIWKNESGAGIYTRVNPNSITMNQSFPALESRYRTTRSMVERARGTSFAPSIPLLCREIYYVARAAFRTGETALGREALAFARNEGYRDHPGTLAHRLATSVLGLEWKIRLWKGH